MTFRQCLLASAVAGALSFAGLASALPTAEMNADEDRIAADFESAKRACDNLTANAKDVCIAKAEGTEKVATAELNARKSGTVKDRIDARIARAEADYDVAEEKCDDLAGNAKDVCVKDAKAALARSKAEASADQAATKAQKSANEKVADARQNAAEDERDANYAAAKERCDRFSGDAKDRCVMEAKARHNIK